MSYIEEIWQRFQNVVETIGRFVEGIASYLGITVEQTLQNPTSIFAFGTMLWDALIYIADRFKETLSYIGDKVYNAITELADTIGGWIYNAFQSIASLGSRLKEGIEKFASSFYSAITKAYETMSTYISNAIAWLSSSIKIVGERLWEFGNWIYNSAVKLWNSFVSALKGVWNTITTWFSEMIDSIFDWFDSTTTSVNEWFTNLMTSIRRKLKQTIIADLTIWLSWKSAERFTTARSVNDLLFGLGGVVLSPIPAIVMAEIVEQLVPTPSTTPLQIIPPIARFSYKPPELTIEEIPEPAQPTRVEVGVVPTAFPGIVDLTAEVETSFESIVPLAPLDLVSSISTGYETEVGYVYMEYISASIGSALELEVTPAVDLTSEVGSELSSVEFFSPVAEVTTSLESLIQHEFLGGEYLESITATPSVEVATAKSATVSASASPQAAVAADIGGSTTATVSPTVEVAPSAEETLTVSASATVGVLTVDITAEIRSSHVEETYLPVIRTATIESSVEAI